MSTGKVKNWAAFQHYKDRSPPWIKLHRELLDDYAFTSLPVASKALAPLIWLLAAETQDGTVSLDPEWLAWRLRSPLQEVIDGLSPLIERGFLVPDSKPLAKRLQRAIPEGEGEAETERDKEQEHGHEVPAPSPILSAYHAILPKCQAIAVMGPKRKRLLATATKQAKAVCAEQGWPYVAADFWHAYFTECSKDEWLRGDKANPNNPAWVQKIETLLDEKRFSDVMDRAIANMRAGA